MPETRRCNRMHGHSRRVELTVAGPADPRTGWLIDFYDIEKIFGPLLARLDHHCLIFSYTGLPPEEATRLREEPEVYAMKTGRICVAAVNTHNIDHGVDAIEAVVKG